MTKEDVIAYAKSHIGVRETGVNEVIYNEYYYGHKVSGDAYPWCVVFLYYVFNTCGVVFPKTAHCDGVMAYAKDGNGQGKQWITDLDEVQTGDCVIFDYNSDDSGDHIGLVTAVKGNHFTTVEGNYSDSVAEVYRSRDYIIGAFRPLYDESVDGDKSEEEHPNTYFPAVTYGMGMNNPKENVKVFQALLTLAGYNCGTIDGEFGDNTLSALNELHLATDKDTSNIARQQDWENLIRKIFSLL